MRRTASALTHPGPGTPDPLAVTPLPSWPLTEPTHCTPLWPVGPHQRGKTLTATHRPYPSRHKGRLRRTALRPLPHLSRDDSPTRAQPPRMARKTVATSAATTPSVLRDSHQPSPKTIQVGPPNSPPSPLLQVPNSDRPDCQPHDGINRPMQTPPRLPSAARPHLPSLSPPANTQKRPVASTASRDTTSPHPRIDTPYPRQTIATWPACQHPPHRFRLRPYYPPASTSQHSATASNIPGPAPPSTRTSLRSPPRLLAGPTAARTSSPLLAIGNCLQAPRSAFDSLLAGSPLCDASSFSVPAWPRLHRRVPFRTHAQLHIDRLPKTAGKTTSLGFLPKPHLSAGQHASTAPVTDCSPLITPPIRCIFPSFSVWPRVGLRNRVRDCTWENSTR